MLHRKKKTDSPVTVEELVALSLNGLGNKVHGHPVWREIGDGNRELMIFDLPTRSLMRREKFVSVQDQRARARASNYQFGRRKSRTERYSFA